MMVAKCSEYACVPDLPDKWEAVGWSWAMAQPFYFVFEGEIGKSGFCLLAQKTERCL